MNEACDRDLWLERRLTEEGPGDSLRDEARVEGDAELRTEFERLQALQRELDREGAIEREILSGIEDPVTRRAAFPWRWCLVAAALLFLVGLAWKLRWFEGVPGKGVDRPDMLLGSQAGEILDPLRDGEGNLIVRWEASAEDNRYDVRLWPGSAEPAFDEPAFSTKESIRGSQIVVPRAVVEGLGSTLHVEVVEHGAALMPSKSWSRTCHVPEPH